MKLSTSGCSPCAGVPQLPQRHHRQVPGEPQAAPGLPGGEASCIESITPILLVVGATPLVTTWVRVHLHHGSGTTGSVLVFTWNLQLLREGNSIPWLFGIGVQHGSGCCWSPPSSQQSVQGGCLPDKVRAALPCADAGGLQRIHAFLDHWGLVNFEAGEAGGRAAADGPPFELAPVGAWAIALNPGGWLAHPLLRPLDDACMRHKHPLDRASARVIE